MFGSNAEEAIQKELGQLEMRNTFTPLNYSSMRKEDVMKSLESHMFLEEKRNGSIKARLVAGGNKQRIYTDKNKVGSPTCKTESILITCVIDALQNRDVATIDIPNAFVQTEVKEHIIVVLRGELCSHITRIFPEKYKDYVMKAKNENLMFILS